MIDTTGLTGFQLYQAQNPTKSYDLALIDYYNLGGAGLGAGGNTTALTNDEGIGGVNNSFKIGGSGWMQWLGLALMVFAVYSKFISKRRGRGMTTLASGLLGAYLYGYPIKLFTKSPDGSVSWLNNIIPAFSPTIASAIAYGIVPVALNILMSRRNVRGGARRGYRFARRGYRRFRSYRRRR